MGTWIKETDVAIYLMQGGHWISRITKYPSPKNPKEKIANITGLRSWFTRQDYPRAMTVSIGSGEPEPQPMTPPKGGVEGKVNTANKINAAGLEVIKIFEGLRTTAYPDPGTGGEPWTIGYGHTSAAGPPSVYPGLKITAGEAEEILKRDLYVFEKVVLDAVKIDLNSNQFSALVSFTFNVGAGAFRSSTLLNKINAGNVQGAGEEFPRWVYAGGRVLAGLQRRRKAERALFLGQNYQQYL
jgi:GH24 family phage-related lysozyme (muramidase)